VSTQVGCAVGCVFCMTGRAGLLRQLSSAEIVAQVVLARSLRPVKKVVFMRMGEPAHNLDNVLEAIEQALGSASDCLSECSTTQCKYQGGNNRRNNRGQAAVF
jgi:23S rRNA (adenine2503-C2)-methyltransferase